MKKLVGSLLLIGAFLSFSFTDGVSKTLPGGGGTGPGCRVNPDNLLGACMKSTEDVWTCIANTEPKDCTSTD